MKSVVMYAGRVVERGTVDDIFYNPLHPYTQGLLKSIPILGKTPQKTLPSIPGTVPHPLGLPDRVFIPTPVFGTDAGM